MKILGDQQTLEESQARMSTVDTPQARSCALPAAAPEAGRNSSTGSCWKLAQTLVRGRPCTVAADSCCDSSSRDKDVSVSARLNAVTASDGRNAY